MTYILKSRRVRRGMPLGEDAGTSWFDDVKNAVTSTISDTGTAISNIPLTNGAGTVGGAFNYAANASTPAPASSSSSAISSAADAFFSIVNKNALPTAPTVIVQKAPGISTTTMIALAVGGVALVALLAKRGS